MMNRLANVSSYEKKEAMRDVNFQQRAGNTADFKYFEKTPVIST